MTAETWVYEQARTVPCLLEAKVILTTITNEVNTIYRNVTDIDRTILGIDLNSGTITAKDIEMLNIKLTDNRVNLLKLKQRFNESKTTITTTLKNFKKYTTQLFKDETKDFKYVTEKTEYIDNAITEGINSAIGNGILNPVADLADKATINSANIGWDIVDQLSKIDTDFGNLLSIIDTLVFTIKSIREILLKDM